MKKPINEEIKRMQILAGILKEEEIDNMSDEEKIDRWYWQSNPGIENLSQKQIEDGIKAHQEEWLGSKQFYDNIEDYFEDVERQGDWYGYEFDDDEEELDEAGSKPKDVTGFVIKYRGDYWVSMYDDTVEGDEAQVVAEPGDMVTWKSKGEIHTGMVTNEENEASLDPGYRIATDREEIEWLKKSDEDEDDIWTDPAGGRHHGNEDDPAAKYA